MNQAAESVHDAAWRDPAQVIAHWEDAGAADPEILRYRTRGDWWSIIEDLGITLVATREYEHLVTAFSIHKGRQRSSHLRIPHPSGIAVDLTSDRVLLASTRNPNQVIELAPIQNCIDIDGADQAILEARPLIPTRTRFLPGGLYLHDLAFIGSALHGNAVGQNAVIRFDDDLLPRRVWWPECIETRDGPVFSRNHLQLNSIAAGQTLQTSYFSASSDRISSRRPGHLNFPVDGRGVVFSGRSRRPVITGLTRPHSARLHDSQIWVANSGYGEVGVGVDGAFETRYRLPGWTRGLCFYANYLFVGTSKVLPRFRQYAPGLDVDASECGVFIIDLVADQVVGSMVWPAGNQTFAIECIPRSSTAGLPFTRRSSRAAVRQIFFGFDPAPVAE